MLCGLYKTFAGLAVVLLGFDFFCEERIAAAKTVNQWNGAPYH